MEGRIKALMEFAKVQIDINETVVNQFQNLIDEINALRKEVNELKEKDAR